MPGRRIAVALAAATTLIASHGAAQVSRHINPVGLAKPTGYTHVVVGPDGRTVHIAGQVAWDSNGAVVGNGDMRAQAERVYQNLEIALASVGATFRDVIKTTTFVTDVSQLAALREVRARYLDPDQPPASTLVEVSRLVRPELLVEVEAVAMLAKALP